MKTIILVLMIVFMSMMIFRTDREHYRLEAEQYRNAYVKALAVIEEMKDETVESVKFQNNRLTKAYWSIKDNRKDQWPYSEEEWIRYKGEK